MLPRTVAPGCPCSVPSWHFESADRARRSIREGTATVKFALHFGNLAFPDPEGARRLVRLAEVAGFDSVFAVEHVVVPDNYESVYPYAPGGRLPGGPSVNFPDPLIWLTWVAAATTRPRFMTPLMILPQRTPLVLAKEVATLDYLSGGRIELGIGVGWLKEEFDALGIPFERRGKRADEYVAAMRALWAGDGASFAGEFVSFDKMNCNPKPVARSVPIVVGGHSEAAARRAGRLGDGFFPSIGAQVDTMPLLDVVRRSAEQAGRDPAIVELILGCPGALPNSGSDPRGAVEERIARGVGRLALPVMAFLPDLETRLARFGEEIIKPYANA